MIWQHPASRARRRTILVLGPAITAGLLVLPKMLQPATKPQPLFHAVEVNRDYLDFRKYDTNRMRSLVRRYKPLLSRLHSLYANSALGSRAATAIHTRFRKFYGCRRFLARITKGPELDYELQRAGACVAGGADHFGEAETYFGNSLSATERSTLHEIRGFFAAAQGALQYERGSYLECRDVLSRHFLDGSKPPNSTGDYPAWTDFQISTPGELKRNRKNAYLRTGLNYLGLCNKKILVKAANDSDWIIFARTFRLENLRKLSDLKLRYGKDGYKKFLAELSGQPVLQSPLKNFRRINGELVESDFDSWAKAGLTQPADIRQVVDTRHRQFLNGYPGCHHAFTRLKGGMQNALLWQSINCSAKAGLSWEHLPDGDVNDSQLSPMINFYILAHGTTHYVAGSYAECARSMEALIARKIKSNSVHRLAALCYQGLLNIEAHNEQWTRWQVFQKNVTPTV